MKNPYSGAIEALKNVNKENAVDIVFEIAKSNPSVLAKIQNRTSFDSSFNPSDETMFSVRRLLESISMKRRIESIKQIRNITKCGLKEAKNLVDEFLELF